MPELPEVETSKRGISPHLINQTVKDIVIRQPQLRWLIPDTIFQLIDTTFTAVSRRAKYLLLQSETGTVILHLGMSGSLRIVDAHTPPQKHDHVDIILANKRCLRLTDPRRFGAVLWTTQDPFAHSLLARLGPEPLSAEFNSSYMYQLTRKRAVAIKKLIMDSKVVVGVGNIYANEALFLAGLYPERAANTISAKKYSLLVNMIKQVLQAAIEQGGTTLRDFQSSEGKPGYFKQQLLVYGRGSLPCFECKESLREIRINQRTTVYCQRCQR